MRSSLNCDPKVWCDGTITNYDLETMKHGVLYDDGDSRQYNFLTKPSNSFKLFGSTIKRETRRAVL